MTRRARTLVEVHAPSPGRGGARPGAGRKRTGATVQPVQFHLPPDVLATIDARRGAVSRSRWVAEVIRGAVDRSVVILAGGSS